MAEALAVSVIARLTWKYEFEEVFDTKSNGLKIKGGRRSQNSLTLPMEGGLPCIVRRRNTISRDDKVSSDVYRMVTPS